MSKKQLKDVFIPFHYVPSTYYLSIAGLWIGGLIVLWLFAPVLLPAPLEVGKQLYAYLSDSEFYSDIMSSVMLTLFGMVLSILSACLIAYLSVISLFKPLSYFIVKIRYMSMAGFMFTFTILLSGKADEVKLAMMMLSISPFFALTLLNVIEKIDQKEFDLWTTLRYNKWEQLWHIVIRGKLDLTLEAIRSNFAIAWIMIIMVETYSMAGGGVGVLLYKAAGKTQIDKVMALQLIILLLGIGFDYSLKTMRYKLFPHIALAEKQ